MRLSTREATITAIEFMRQGDFPRGSVAHPRKYIPEIGGRFFHILLDETTLNKTFCLMKLIVLDDGTVQVKQDRRERVQEIFSKAGMTPVSAAPPAPESFDHSTAVQVFFDAVVTMNKPSWLRSVQKRTDCHVRSYTDGYAHVSVPNSTKLTAVPFKIKTSKLARDKYRLRHGADAVVLLVRPSIPATTLRARFLQLLALKRKKLAHM